MCLYCSVIVTDTFQLVALNSILLDVVALIKKY